MVASPRPAAYHLLSLAGKQAAAREQLVDPPDRCPGCGTATTPADFAKHVDERCPGAPEREPGPASSWVDRQYAEKLGVPAETLHYWARRGLVRTRGDRMDRKYLFRDLARRVAIRRLDRRR